MNPISNTAFYCCGVRMDDAKRERSVCNDLYAERFMDERGFSIYEPFRSEKMPNLSNVTRCRIIDDYVSSELKSSGNVNIVTIGAGFDTRPYRLAGGNWIELDEPQIVVYKNENLPVSECSNSLQRIPIDFSSEKLSDKLENVDKVARTIVVIEGVFMYLDRKAIERTLETIREMFSEHELYCDLMSKRFFEEFGESIHSKLISTGARFSDLFDRPEEIFISHKYQSIERVTIFKRSSEFGVLWDRAGIPKFVAWLILNVFKKELNGYSVHHFRYKR